MSRDRQGRFARRLFGSRVDEKTGGAADKTEPPHDPDGGETKSTSETMNDALRRVAGKGDRA